MAKFGVEGLRERQRRVKEALSSKEAFLAAIETKESATGRLAHRNPWTNEDLDVSPREHWTWRWWDFAAFWWSYGMSGPNLYKLLANASKGFSTGVWSAGSSLVAIGLTWWQAIICIFVSHFLGAVGMVMHSRVATTYHIGFPVESRIAWGLRGAYFPVLVRVLVGTIWVGVQNIQGGYFMAVLLRCIFGKSFANLHNPIPSSSDITIQELIGLIIFWLVDLSAD